MPTLLDIIKKVDSTPYPHEIGYEEFRRNVYLLISHDGTFQLGYLIPAVVAELTKHPQYFIVSAESKTVQINPSLETFELREAAFSEIGKEWRKNKLFITLEGWRDELYIIYSKTKEPYFKLERAMCPLFGVVMYGVHINGYVKTADGKLKLWIPRRAANKATYPGMLDNMVAGGLGYPYGPLETCYKECYEEAGLEKEYISEHINSCGVVSYLYQLTKGDYFTEAGLIQPEVEYIYDIELDETMVPYPVDHEAENFRLMSIEEMKERILNQEFKDNCAAIIIDFMMRHSLITAENEFDFIEINNRVHRFLPFPVRKN